jgi:two-component system LytT family response regulator
MPDAHSATAGATRVLIVDDEPIARRGARRILDGYRGITIAGECRSGPEAVRAIHASRPDVVLLDIQMPGLDGFGVLREIGAEEMPAVVFVTAFDDFAVRAFEHAAVDYVVKPYTDERLLHAIDRAIARREGDRAAKVQEQLRALLALSSVPRIGGESAAPAPPAPLSRLLVTVGSRSIVVPLDDVSWIRADDYCATVFAGTRSYVLRESLAELERRLDPAVFVRVHRSAIVRVGAVHALDRGVTSALVCILHDGTRVPVSRARREAVIASLGDARG